MIFIIGGSYQGKRNYAASLRVDQQLEWLDGGRCGEQEVFAAPCIYNFQLYVRRFLMEKNETALALFLEELQRSTPDLILICDEVGAGVVPLDREERQYRECVGRFSCLAADAAKEVHRVVCGLGIILKKN